MGLPERFCRLRALRAVRALGTFQAMRAPLALASLAACSALLLACEADSPPSVFVGTVGDGDVFAASLWQDNRVIVYTCGVDGSLDTETAWLSAPPVDGDIQHSEGRFSVVATREANMIRGTFTSQTGTGTLDLLAVTDTADAGFFLTTEGTCRTAAVAFRQGGEMLVQGARFCDAEGPFSQVTPVLPPETLGDTLLVRFDDGSGLRELALERVRGI